MESIKIQGFDGFYLPNNNEEARDLIYGENPVKKFKSAFPLELYLSQTTEYLGDQELFTKFGLQIKDNCNVIVSKRTFAQRVPQNSFSRPREGDLIYIPFLNGTGELYEIKFTEQAKDFFMLGRKVPYFYELQLEKFKYSQETIDTGVDDIDVISQLSQYTIYLEVGSGSGTFQDKETIFQSVDYTLANAYVRGTVTQWTPTGNTVGIANIAGEFQANVAVIGATSNAQYMVVQYDPLAFPSSLEVYDNQTIGIESDAVKNTDETNPMGGPGS